MLAFEVTKLVHGEEEANKAASAASALFGGGAMAGSVPTTEITAEQLAADARLTSLLTMVGIAKSNSAARKLVEQNAVSINDEKVTDVNYALRAEDIPADGLMIRSGKKTYHRILLKG